MPHQRPSWPQRPDGGRAPEVTRAMATHGLQLVLWTPWPHSLQHISRRRYCVNWVGYRSHLLLCDHWTRARRSARCPSRAPSGHLIRPICTKTMISKSSCCQSRLSSLMDGMQANGKPLVSSTHAQTTTLAHGPDGPTRGRAEATWGWRQNGSSKAGVVLHTRSHEACCLSMMRINVPEALVAMG